MKIVDLNEIVLTKEKKIIGYKLVKPEYEEAIKKMINCGNWWFENANNNFKENGWHFINENLEGSVKKRLEKTGVLELWFEPVYENLKKKELIVKKNPEKNIIGYKLIKSEYKEAIKKIIGSGNWWVNNTERNFKENGWHFINNNAEGSVKITLEKAGVLDLWFEPVYENLEEIKFIESAIEFSLVNVKLNLGGPFGAVIVKDGIVISSGQNSVTRKKDCTAHAEIEAIRNACQVLNTFDLTGCEIYSSCEPCPMCLSAIYWARIGKLFYANSKEDAERIGFSDKFIYEEIAKPVKERTLITKQLMNFEGLEAFKLWENQIEKIKY